MSEDKYLKKIKELQTTLVYSDFLYAQEEEIAELFKINSFLSCMLPKEDLTETEFKNLTESMNHVGKYQVVSNILYKSVFDGFKERAYCKDENKVDKKEFLSILTELKTFAESDAEALFISQEIEIELLFLNNLNQLKILESIYDKRNSDMILFYMHNTDYVDIYNKNRLIIENNKFKNLRERNLFRTKTKRNFEMKKEDANEYRRIQKKINESVNKFYKEQ